MNPVIKSKHLPCINYKEIYIVDTQVHVSKKNAQMSQKLTPEQAVKKKLEDAGIEADEIIENAKIEAEIIRNTAYQEGYQTGMGELDEKRDDLEKRAKGIEKEAEKQIEEFWKTIEPELLKLAVDISRQIIGKQIEEDDTYVLTTVKNGLHQLRDKREIKIRVNPEDFEFMRTRKDEITMSCEGLNSVEIIDDRRVGQGGCLIETSNGDLDARIETQLGEVERALLEAERDGKNEVTTES